MSAPQQPPKNRPYHIFELFQALYPELHRRMMEAMDKEDKAYQATLKNIEKLRQGNW